MPDERDYDKGALAALALFSKAANMVPPVAVNPAPVMGSAVTQAATNIHPHASRVSHALVGGATGAALNALMAPSGDRLRQGAIGFASDAIGSSLGPWGMLASPAINMALQHFTAPSEEKRADHADDRLKQRIKAEFPPDALAKLRAQAKELELAPGRYYLPMKDKAGNTAAIAAFKTVGPKDQLVLATVLAPKKNPPSGTSLSHLMKQPLGSQIAKVDASPKQYTIRKKADGRYTCTCKSFKFTHGPAGTNCKHIEEHLGNTKESANKLERFLLNQGAVSEPQKASLRGQFGRLTERPTAKSKALASQALALKPGAQQEASLQALRGLMQTPRYPDTESLARTRRINELSLTPKLRQLGGKSLDANYWKDRDPTFFYDEKKRFATPGEYRARSMRLGEEPAPTGLRAEHVLRSAAAGKPIDTKLSPEQGQLVMYPDALKVQRARLNKQRTTPDQTKPWDATDMRQTLEHEAGERKMVLEGMRKGKATTPYSSHWGSAADVAANQVAAKDPKSQWVPNNPSSFIEKEHWNRLYKQHGGTRGSPIPSDSRASRSLDKSIANVMAKAPLNEKTRPDLTEALNAGVAGMPLHPNLEARLTRDFTKLKPELGGVSPVPEPSSETKSQRALEALKKRTRMKTSAEEEQEEPPQEGHLLRNALMAAGAAAPFAGLIGQERAIHEGQGKHVSHQQLRGMARPGDVLLSGDTALTPVKALLSVATGTPKGYHAATVVGPNGKLMESHPAYGYEPGKIHPDEHLQLLRPNHSPEEISQMVKGTTGLESSVSAYEKQIAKNLRGQHGFNSSDASELASGSRKGFYNNPEGILAGIKDLFIPKIRSPESIEAKRQEILGAREKFKLHHRSAARSAAADINARNTATAAGADIDYSGIGEHLPNCVAGVCSTIPASYMPKDKPVVPGKLPSEVLPSDYLRSRQYTPVASTNPLGAGKSTLSDKILRHGPLGIRAGLGLGLAGGIYGLSRLMKPKREEEAEKTSAAPEVPMSGEQQPEEAAPPMKEKTPWWKPGLGTAGALAAGLGTYALMRRPTYSANPALRAIQQKANQGGYKRLVDVSTVVDEHGAPEINKLKPLKLKENLQKIWANRGLGGSQKFLENAWEHGVAFSQPQVHPDTGKMNLANRFKLWLREGEGAVPVASARNAQGEGKLWIPGHEGPGKLDLSGKVVAGRPQMAPYADQPLSSLVRGGTDIEGSPATQKALTHLAAKGKGYEADVLQRFAPGTLPSSVTNLAKWTKSTSLPTERYARASAIQARMKRDLRAQGMKEFALKPASGLASGAEFPLGSENWAAQLRQYDRHMANPENVKRFSAAEQVGPGDVAWYLGKHGLLQGHTVHNLLKDPRSAFAQHWLPGATDEWRVHTLAGDVPKSTMLPRYFSNDPIAAAKSVAGLDKDDYRDAMQRFVKEDVLAKLPEKYRQGRYGLDVMPFVDPKTGVRTFKVIEMNPFERPGMYGSEGGGSGLIDAVNVPWMGHAEHRVATGRHSQPVALAGALGAGAMGGVGGLLAKHFITKPEDTDEETPHPVG